MKLKKMKIEETIQEEEETGVSTSRGRRRTSVQQAHENVETGTSVGSPSRPRRASSITPAKPSPGRTRRTSGSSASSLGTTTTPKSPSRRGRPRGIETIAE
ncbi:hypothetical protein OESDEN_07271 [Oesophagostomum dentatum]|uniref:Uncharacterized protein n=1 Tax=Oesophagostomum dentatum TaxID=61180 RepID=A0A0B1TAI8_OESDE|nr:hypothetical protein OESDEN_07271 [Oesophagostomum dentatum]